METYVVAMRARILTLVGLLLLAGCSSIPSLLYKIEIQQGNVITQEMVNKLKPGMTRSQVRFALGSPMISDAFHENRWDYVYRLEQKGKLVEQRHLAVFFEGDKLVRTNGTFTPSLAFVQPPSVEPSMPGESTRPMVKDESSTQITKKEGADQIPADIPASSREEGLSYPETHAVTDIPASNKEVSGVPASSDIAAQRETPAAASMAASSGIPYVSEASGLPEPEKRGPKLVPSPSADLGNKEADLQKE
ncbi:outer membrane protein assembly factor BamE [Nitrosospira sp. Nsp11]|uniref:outer membrane protein assembly factor BamE n=1 Tax=Nitrosospira sp. Nsp11 TaxID=1855338 RepID=UPI00091F1117|nr:outer membrane protein assembly factor BamE [Nitrosospira sp. Nsp11]SHL22970.1 outer membrane protein assembly factor BamE [Nitrosospira sp. Nsp11]